MLNIREWPSLRTPTHTTHETRYQYPIRPLYRAITHVLTIILARTALLLVGLYWIPVDVVARKRG